MKQAIYAELAKRLEAECGVPPTDLIVSCNQNTREDWSFGYVVPLVPTGPAFDPLKVLRLMRLHHLRVVMCPQYGQSPILDWRPLEWEGRDYAVGRAASERGLFCSRNVYDCTVLVLHQASVQGI